MKKVMTQHLPKNKALMWFLMAITILLGGFSLITASWLYKLRNESISLARPESNPEASSATCSMSFSIPTPTPTPTPTSSSQQCANCQYQASVFWGPTISSFAGGLRYSTGNRLIRTVSNTTSSYPGCTLSPVTPQSPPSLPTFPSGCDNPVGRGFLTATINTTNVNTPAGYITATITNTSNTCSYPVGLAAYKANGTNVETQNLFDQHTVTLPTKQTMTLLVKSPMNNDAPSCHQIPPICTTITPYDPPHGICAQNGVTGSAFWEWRHVNATQYEVDIYRANGTLFLNNDWQNLSAFSNCQLGKCSYVTNNMPIGAYYSRIRARNLGACRESNWHQSITITVAACQ